jgi:lipoate-protein ligase B
MTSPAVFLEAVEGKSRRNPLRVERLGRIDYSGALALQERCVAAKLAGEMDDSLLLLEHDPVYTLGRGAKEADLLGAPERLGVAAYRVGRGGGVTYHGPGQLVAYPIIALAAHGRDVHRYIGRLESTLIDVCADFGVAARRCDGLTGVWVEDRKIASIGVGVRRWVTFHGVALNVDPDLDYFRAIVPCAMPEVRMTSLALESGASPSMEAVQDAFVRRFRQTFGYAGEAGGGA